MTINDWGVIIALLLSGAALVLELRRWIEGKPNLSLSVMAEAKTFPDDDGRKKLVMTVTNRGSLPTTITQMVAFYSRSPIHKLFSRYFSTGIVNNPSQIQPIPFEIDINRMWHGVLYYNEELLKVRKKGQLYVGVFASHMKQPTLIRVREPKPLPEKTFD